MSESQERMMAVVEPGDVEGFLEICAKWDVLATVIGEVTDGDRLVIDWHGETIVDVLPRPSRTRARSTTARTPARRGRTACRPTPPRRSDWPARPAATSCEPHCCRWRPRPTCATSPGSPTSTTATCAATRSSPSPRTPGMLRLDEETGLGVALATDGNGRFALLDPYAGRAARAGRGLPQRRRRRRQPVAITDCLNFGSPEDPGVMWQFAEAVRGLADGCLELGIPGHRRQRELLQPDRHERRSCRPR